MALDSIRDVTEQMFPIQSPILLKKGKDRCRVIIDYKQDVFFGIYDATGMSLEDMLPIASIFRLVEGGVAILFFNRDGAPFVHILQQNQEGFIEAHTVRESEPVPSHADFVFSQNEEYNKLSCLFSSPKKVERSASFI